MKKTLAVVTSLFIFLGVVPSFANQVNTNPNDIAKTNKSRLLINLQEAHNKGYTGKDQVIVIIDDGVVLSNPVFTNRVIDGYCSSSVVCGEYYKKSGIEAGAAHKQPGFTFIPGHGTLVASIAAGNSVGSFPGGIAPDAKIISINNNNGNHQGILLALDWILSVKNKYNIAAVNASFGFSPGGDRNRTDYCPIVSDIDQRLRELKNSNIPFVAAAGNNGGYTTVHYPACNTDTISVGALDENGKIETYSDISKEISVVAPAQVLGASAENNGFVIGAGTSSAAPVVAGSIAILKQVKPNITFDEIKKALMSSQVWVDDLVYTNLPMLNLKGSIDAVLSGKYSTKTVQKSSTQIVSTSLTYELEKLKNDLSILKTELVALKSENDNKQSMVNSLTNQLGEIKKSNAELVIQQNTLNAELASEKKKNADLLKKVKVICSSKSRSAMCRSLGL